MAILSGIQTTLSGMKTAQAQLDIIGRNIANVDTEGYTRKTAQQNNVILAGNHAGVALADIKRNVNQGLLRSFLGSNSLSSNLSSKSEYLSKTEVLLGTPEGNNSISANVADLQAYFNSFAIDVSSASARYSLLTSAQTMTNRLNYVSTEIQKIRGDADIQISATIDKINNCLVSLSSLNDDIVRYNVLGYDGVADLEDSRDQALRELSSYLDISYFERENGEIVVQTTNGIMLLDRDPHKLSHSPIAQAAPTSSYNNGSITGIYVDGKDITTSIKDGEIKGLIDVRDTILPSLQAQLDELAGTLKNTINEIHNKGTAYPNTPFQISGNRSFLDPSTQKISIEEGDVRFIIFDSKGQQISTTSLVGNMGFSSGSVSDMASALETWLQSSSGPNLPLAKVSFDKEGKLQIETGDSDYSISIVDEAGPNPGSKQQNAKIAFDANGDGQYDRTFDGFSSFFGLNDLFVSSGSESIYDSKVLSMNANLGLKDTAKIGFSNSYGLNFGEVEILSTDGIKDIVSKINNNPDLKDKIRASLVPNGSGYVLRIEDINGAQLELTDNSVPQSNLLKTLNISPSNVGCASSIKVRSDIQIAPELIANGSPIFSSTSGKYELNQAANDIANEWLSLLQAPKIFPKPEQLAKPPQLWQTTRQLLSATLPRPATVRVLTLHTSGH